MAGKEIRSILDEKVAQLYWDLDGGFTTMAWLLPTWVPLPSFRWVISQVLGNSSTMWITQNSESAIWNWFLEVCLLQTLSLGSRDVYVPNAVKRSIWDQCKKYIHWRLTDDCWLSDQWPTSHLETFKWPYLHKGSTDPLHVWFYGGVFGVGGSNGTMSRWTKFNRYVGENNVRGVIRLVTV